MWLAHYNVMGLSFHGFKFPLNSPKPFWHVLDTDSKDNSAVYPVNTSKQTLPIPAESSLQHPG